MRHKEVHGVNVHPSVKFALDFGMSLISEKIRKRIKIYTSLQDGLDRKMDTSMLPKEYGGTMPMKEMIGKKKRKHNLIENKVQSSWLIESLILFRTVEEGIAGN